VGDNGMEDAMGRYEKTIDKGIEIVKLGRCEGYSGMKCADEQRDKNKQQSPQGM